MTKHLQRLLQLTTIIAIAVLMMGMGPVTKEKFQSTKVGPLTITEVGPMTISRAGHTATVLKDGRVLLTGGYHFKKDGNSYLDTMEIYDPETKRFTELKTRMLEPRSNHTATLLENGNVTIVGGWEGTKKKSSHIELYNINNNSLSLFGDLKKGRRNHASILFNNNLYIIGGFSDKREKNIEIIDFKANSISLVEGLKFGRVYANVLPFSDSLIIVGGGFPMKPFVNNTIESFNISNKKNSVLGMFEIPRSGPLSLKLNDGDVLIFGGYNKGHVKDVEIFNVETKKSKIVARIENVVAIYRGMKLNDENVLFIAKNNRNRFVPITFNLETFNYTILDYYLLRRAHFELSKLKSGDILITGDSIGYDKCFGELISWSSELDGSN